MSTGSALQESDTPAVPDQNEVAEPVTTTSQGFYPPPEPSVLRRSLILSAAASCLGSAFFTIVQGTVFNFFLEDLNLRQRLPFFMGLWCLGSLGALAGSVLQERYGCRLFLFMFGCGASRLLWLPIGLLPFFGPQFIQSPSAFYWLSALTLLFYFIHSMGSTPWLTWMADLVPKKMQGRYWSLRQVGCSGAAVLARLGSGYFLDPFHKNHDLTGYTILFCAATVIGVMDVLMFFGVTHRRPIIRAKPAGVFSELARRLKEAPLRRLCAVYLIWSCSNCLIGPTLYFFMRDQVKMGVAGISVVESISLVALTGYTLLWGKYSDRHGLRGPLVLCLIVHALCPMFYFPAKAGDDYLIAMGFAVGAIGFCGINLFMWPLLINFTKGKGGGRETGMAIFTAGMGLANFLAFTVADRWLFGAVGWLLKLPGDSVNVYLAIIAFCMFLRFWSAWIAWHLPREAHETAPMEVITEVVSTNPLRAALSFFKYVIGQEEWHTGP
ncbi:MAG TPA: MFS transporter [Planctomycetota bacterium]|jgi:Na+/melibiose symporter-like transporter